MVMRRLYTRLTWITSSAEWAETFRTGIGKRTTPREKRSSVFALDGVVGSGCELRNADRSGAYMETVTVSPTFQVVIPRKVRESLDIRPGQKVRVALAPIFPTAQR